MKIIYDARIINESKRFIGYVVIDGEFITEVGEGFPEKIPEGAELIGADGAYLIPGAIDTHVHFREPGLTHKASIATESAAAVAGGVTSFFDMPNTKPATTSMEAVEQKLDIAARSSFANYAFFIGATNDNIDQLLAADYTRIPGVKLFLGSSTGNMLVNDPDALKRLFSEFKGVIAVHAEDEGTIARNCEWLRNEYGDNAPVTLHSLLRSREACLKSSQLAIAFARKYGSRLHILHISTDNELSLAGSEGAIADKKITMETCPHYLYFTAESLVEPRGYVRKCNPAIKGPADRDALRKALADNKIDIIATDHAPHLLSEKQGSLFKAASGMPGVKFMLPLMLELTCVDNPVLTLDQVVEKLSHNPARLYNIDRRGFIRPGYYADLVLVKGCLEYTLNDADTLSHLPEDMRSDFSGCDWTPYQGITLHHRVVATFVNGELAFDGTTSHRHRPLAIRFQN